MLNPVQAVYGFSGISKAGKSRLTEAFCAALEPHRDFRAKIVYFNIASQRLGQSVYTPLDREQALLSPPRTGELRKSTLLASSGYHRELASRWSYAITQVVAWG